VMIPELLNATPMARAPRTSVVNRFRTIGHPAALMTQV
jgi:hypothetical protein